MRTNHSHPTSLLDLRYFSETGSPAYDAVGNLLTIYDHKMGSPQKHSFAYDDMDRLTSASVTGGSLGLYSESYTYDDNTGNLASKGGVSYTYGDYSHVHAVTSLGNGNTYSYDGDGVRVKGTVNGVTTDYVGEILEWTGSTSTMVKYYAAGSDRVAMKKGTTLYWLIGDHPSCSLRTSLGSTSVVANSSGGLHSKMLYKILGTDYNHTSR